MRAESKRSFHFGVTFVFAPGEPVSPASILRFQQQLAEVEIGILFDVVQRSGDHPTTLLRRSPPLQVAIGSIGPQGAQLTQFAITAPDPQRSSDDFTNEAEDLVRVFRAVFPSAQQVLSRACSIHSLYAVQGTHAFQYLWERRLHQAGAELQLLERPILGGGVRFVLPPPVDGSNSALVELKIESLLSDPSQLYVDTAFTWQVPSGIDIAADPGAMIAEVAAYEDGPVTNFLLSGASDNT